MMPPRLAKPVTLFDDPSAPLVQQLPKKAPVAAALLFAAAADRKISRVRERSQDVQEAAIIALVHFRQILPGKSALATIDIGLIPPE